MSFSTTSPEVDNELGQAEDTYSATFTGENGSMKTDHCIASSSLGADTSFVRLQACAKGRCYRREFTRSFRQQFVKLLDDADENEPKARRLYEGIQTCLNMDWSWLQHPKLCALSMRKMQSWL
uniref:Uncharacterized protein n=1 Tax=Ditylenchus dipsaci TaxID=166011 RepID=A0A915DTP4_9BILA